MADKKDMTQYGQQINTLLSAKGMQVGSQTGLTNGALAALLVNGIYESSLDPNADNGTHEGIWQWSYPPHQVTKGDMQNQVDYMFANDGQYIAHNTAWWGPAGYAEPASLANIDTWPQFLSADLDPTDMVIGFIGNWERPGIQDGLDRIGYAKANVAELQTVVGDGAGYQVPQWPFRKPIQFTQGPLQFDPNLQDHVDFAAYDLQSSDDISLQMEYYAPFDMTCTEARYESGVRVFVSDDQVQRADGTVGYLGIGFFHDMDESVYVVGKKYAQGDVCGHMGKQGQASGIHVHMNTVNLASNKDANWTQFTFEPALSGDASGNVDDGGETWPNPYTTVGKAVSLGMMTANNVFSVTDEQKSMMKNAMGAHVNIDAFKYIAPGSKGKPKDPAKDSATYSQDDRLMGIFASTIIR